MTTEFRIVQAQVETASSSGDKRELSQYGCGSESTFGPLSEAGGDKTASSFTSGPGCRDPNHSNHTTPGRGKAAAVPATTSVTKSSPAAAAGAPPAAGIKKSTSFSDRFSKFIKELIAPKKPTASEPSPPAAPADARARAPEGVTGGPLGTDQSKRAASHADPSAIEPNRQSLLFRVCATVEPAHRHRMLLSAVADVLEKDRETSRIRNLVRTWLTTAATTKPVLACSSPRTPVAGHPTQRTPTGSLVQASPPMTTNSSNATPKGSLDVASPAATKVVPMPVTSGGQDAHSDTVFSDSRDPTVGSESSPAVRDLLDSLHNMSASAGLSDEDVTQRTIRFRLFDFYERYDPLHIPSEAAINAVLAARIPEHVLFHFLQSKYGLLPPASPSPKRHSAAEGSGTDSSESPLALRGHIRSTSHLGDLAISDSANWHPGWDALLAPFVPHPDFQPLVWTTAAKLNTIERFKRLPHYFTPTAAGRCQEFMFEGHPVVLNHSKRTALFPPLPRADNMFGLPPDALADLEDHTPPVPDGNSCLSYAVPRQWVRRKDTRRQLAFAAIGSGAGPHPAPQKTERSDAASDSSDLGDVPLGDFNAWF